MTVKEATHKAFIDMPDLFHVLMLCRKVKQITGRQHLMDGTITRKLRELRSDGTIRYELTDKSRSIYSKNGQTNIYQLLK
jgi:hypothetical protein